MLTQADLKHRVHYDPLTGIFTWISARGRRVDQLGKQAGNLSPHGYIRITVNRTSYFAHRLAWLYMTGEHPEAYVDHINMNKTDNRWANLRAANKSENNANSKARGASGLKGAYWSKQINRWYSRIGKRYLGTYDTSEQAHEAYVAAALAEFGGFARAA
jgi:hypothetical protein